jgi:hypothetical protein
MMLPSTNQRQSANNFFKAAYFANLCRSRGRLNAILPMPILQQLMIAQGELAEVVSDPMKASPAAWGLDGFERVALEDSGVHGHPRGRRNAPRRRRGP